MGYQPDIAKTYARSENAVIDMIIDSSEETDEYSDDKELIDDSLDLTF
jgi:hypothetical protein